MANQSIYNAFERLWQHTQVETTQKLTDAKAYTDEKIAAIPAQTDYTVSITETTTGLEDSIAKKYTFTQNGEEIGSINLAKELVVTSGSVKEVTQAGQPYAGAAVGDKYIELVIANQDAPIYVPAKDLVDIYTAKENAAEVQVAISNTNEISATLVNAGITYAKLAPEVAEKLDKTWDEEGAAYQALQDAKDYADGLASNYDESGAAAQALQDAKDYADSLADNYATTAQGELADSALQSVKVLGKELTKNANEITVDEAKTALGLGGAAYKAEDYYAEAEHDHVVADITDFESAVQTKVESYGYATTGQVATAKQEAIDAAKAYADGKEHKNTTYTAAATANALEFTLTPSEGDVQTVKLVAPTVDVGVTKVVAGEDIVVTPAEGTGVVTIAHETFTTGEYTKDPATSDKTNDVYMMTGVTVDNGHVTGANVKSLAHALEALTIVLDGGTSAN